MFSTTSSAVSKRTFVLDIQVTKRKLVGHADIIQDMFVFFRILNDTVEQAFKCIDAYSLESLQ